MSEIKAKYGDCERKLGRCPDCGCNGVMIENETVICSKCGLTMHVLTWESLSAMVAENESLTAEVERLKVELKEAQDLLPF